MLNIKLNLFPEGKPKAVTFSYDDGVTQDIRLIEILNKHNLKGTFHINSGLCDCDNRIRLNDIKSVYEGHEISLHCSTHPFLEHIPRNSVINEIWEDRKVLEGVAGYPVRGMSYPFGNWNNDALGILRELDVAYARTTKATGAFKLPEEPLLWNPTAHHSHDIMDKVKAFSNMRYINACPHIFYIWGHSYEFDNNHNWDLFEELCAAVAGQDEYWYATNIEIIEYLEARKRLIFSADCNIVKNPSAIPVWITAGTKKIEILPGAVVNLAV